MSLQVLKEQCHYNFPWQTKSKKAMPYDIKNFPRVKPMGCKPKWCWAFFCSLYLSNCNKSFLYL